MLEVRVRASRAVAVLAACSILFTGCSPPQSPARSERAAAAVGTALARVDPRRVDDLIASKMSHHAIPGMSIAIVHGGVLVHSRSYGLADVEHAVPATPRSPFKIASLTKPFTAIAILQLVDRGRVSLDQAVSHYLENLPDRWRATTIRQLLGHTSGVPDYLRSPGWSWRDSWRLDLSRQEVISLAAQAPMDFEPGARMRYCNTNYYLLGMVIEAVSGQTYAQYLAAHVVQPLAMSDTRVDGHAPLLQGRVRGYTNDNSQLRNAEFTSDTWAYAEGGVITTAVDLAKLDAALYGEKLLTRRSIDLMWTPTRLDDGSIGVIGDNGAGQPNHYGLGWFISSYKGHRLILAGGNKPGFTCTYFRFVDANLTVVVLSNLSSSPLYGIAGEIAEMYLGS